MCSDRLSMRGMTKKYGQVTVLENVSFNVVAGETHALIGENGAGKSTLLNLLSGVREATAGEIYIDEQKVVIHSPRSAKENGIAMIHQELQNIPELSVFQNMFLGRSVRKHFGLFVDKAKERAMALDILKDLDPSIDPNVPIKELKVAQQQIVEIARALLDNAKIIAMDEPTSSLTPSEFERLAALIKQLTAQGVSIIYVSHKMDEIFKVCDRATILRDGHFIDCVNIADENEESIVTKMVGRKVEKLSHQSYATDEKMLEVKNLSRESAVKNINFFANKGEVVGIAGLVGAGRTELFRLIAGLDKPTSGEILINGQPLKLNSVKESIKMGIGLVPEDRKKEGILKDRSVSINIAMPSMDRFSQAGFLRKDYLNAISHQLMMDLNLKPLDLDKTVGTFSGGNQQKVIIGRWLAAGTKIYLFDEPTRGIDIGTKSEIYNLIENLAKAGNVVLVVSSEMPEIIRVSDRVLVMKEGEIKAELHGSDINEDNIGRYSIGNNKTH
ncbi:sugar ABC transporter ATP-binding protein [Lonepinella koalarum]|uniref:Monosaccharide ABC transporter ATP-binding protein (CUT2 family) n=1 Tax=Lonepinella koalarum TaxID=53417 RepID=A0A4R1L2V1_9PAST|nr:sugar ABC transporter ATP-binding protein [Lonepinella koalarum]MDH2926072.1 ABC transporter [Lonepinella koalarum]TCK71223.1 monosaccharide ABC transporter ATP-binding protein (CUT2 family) [Lonepinella koalarum]TFJ90949.1 sugar ABC transporter ATP-binding protein [Lonepinella koalarum]